MPFISSVRNSFCTFSEKASFFLISGGQKRRTALLRALWAESDTLLLDEPFTGMDPAVMKKAAAMLKARCGTKPTLLATHDKEAIRELGWKVIELG